MSGPQKEILLVRHGNAFCNVQRVIASQSCQGLTETGHRQAGQLARRLASEQDEGHHVVALYSSTVRRAMDTAWPVANLLGTPVVPRADLRVPDPGPHAEGVPWHTVRRKWRTPDPDRPSRPLPPGGEPWRIYLARAHATLADIIADHPGGRVIIVGHNETATAAYTLLIGVPHLHALRVNLDHTGITRLVTAPELPDVRSDVPRWALRVHNDTAHLASSP
jgi:2,3-bisphosphoglycerate-dependent phosphoglycerate mutase